MQGGTREGWASTHYLVATAIACGIPSRILSIDCTGPLGEAEITTAVTLRGGDTIAWNATCGNDDAALLLDVQSFLWCRRVGCPAPARLRTAWERFYASYSPLVCRNIHLVADLPAVDDARADLFQEVWREILCSLQRLTYQPARGRVAAWLVGLTRQTVLRLMADAAHWPRRWTALETAEVDPPCPGLGPADGCVLSEFCEEQARLLATLRAKTSPTTYEVFQQRFVKGQSVGEIGAAMGLSREAVSMRLGRAKRRWDALTEGSAIWRECENVPPP